MKVNKSEWQTLSALVRRTFDAEWALVTGVVSQMLLDKNDSSRHPSVRKIERLLRKLEGKGLVARRHVGDEWLYQATTKGVRTYDFWLGSM